MELELKRVYHAKGTNGTMYHKICETIELPWLKNKRNLSCIPEGRYELKKRYTSKRGTHIMVMDVPGRSGILFHPANDAAKELLGCIAPVTAHTGYGKGSQSRLANKKLLTSVLAALERGEKVFLVIK